MTHGLRVWENEAVRCLWDRRRARGRPNLEVPVDTILQFQGGTRRRRRSRKAEANLAQHTRRSSARHVALVHVHLHGLGWHLARIWLPAISGRSVLLLKAILIRNSDHLLTNLLVSLRGFVTAESRARGRRSRHNLL